LSPAGGVIIDKGFADLISPDGAVGARLYSESSTYQVIGVVDDFQGASMDWTYRPRSVIQFRPDAATQLAVKIASDYSEQVVTSLKDIWATVCPGSPFEYQFLEDAIRANYSDYTNIGRVFLFFSLVSIAIACFGIFALVGYTAQQRTKEIGIRKVLGSSVQGIVALLAREFVFLIGIAAIIASPVAYLLMQGMLQQFPIRAPFRLETFALPALAVVLLAALTASAQAIKAANTDPATSFRYE
jgi:putative ABC transport system permease protein